MFFTCCLYISRISTICSIMSSRFSGMLAVTSLKLWTEMWFPKNDLAETVLYLGILLFHCIPAFPHRSQQKTMQIEIGNLSLYPMLLCLIFELGYLLEVSDLNNRWPMRKQKISWNLICFCSHYIRHLDFAQENPNIKYEIFKVHQIYITKYTGSIWFFSLQ